MNNAVFGKTMENVRKQKDIELVTKWEGRYGAKALIAKPDFYTYITFDNDMVILEMNRTKVGESRQRWVGACLGSIVFFQKVHGEKNMVLYHETF